MRHFRVNEPNVVFEAFDEEIVAVNLDTGNYYSISGSGPKIWMDIANGLSSEEIVDHLQSCYIGEQDTIASGVATFVDRLIAEKLIVEASESLNRNAAAQELVVNKIPFEAPVIEDYSDMQDLLMLDPIHEVDPAGWPVAKTNS
jgi:hypothetical protein